MSVEPSPTSTNTDPSRPIEKLPDPDRGTPVDGSKFLVSIPSGAGENLVLVRCPMCHESLEDQRVSAHIASHSWADLERARERSRFRQSGSGQTQLIPADD